jgi:hypothetical protein
MTNHDDKRKEKLKRKNIIKFQKYISKNTPFFYKKRHKIFEVSLEKYIKHETRSHDEIDVDILSIDEIINLGYYISTAVIIRNNKFIIDQEKYNKIFTKISKIKFSSVNGMYDGVTKSWKNAGTTFYNKGHGDNFYYVSRAENVINIFLHPRYFLPHGDFNGIAIFHSLGISLILDKFLKSWKPRPYHIYNIHKISIMIAQNEYILSQKKSMVDTANSLDNLSNFIDNIDL